MALPTNYQPSNALKIKKGLSSALAAVPPSVATDGNIWITTDTINDIATNGEMRFYSDMVNEDNTAIVRKELSVTNADHATQADQAATATKAHQLVTPRTIAADTAVVSAPTTFSGGQNISIPITNVYGSYIDWGGKHTVGSFNVMDAALIPSLGANRLAGFKSAGITVEYSTDSGVTWLDYGASSIMKQNLCTTSTTLKIGGPSAVAGSTTAANQLRITLDGIDGGLYSQLYKFCLYISTNGSTECTVSIDTSQYSSPTVFTNLLNNQALSGWSGWNILNFSSIGGSGSFGGNNNSAHIKKMRFTFTSTGCSTLYPGLSVMSLYAYGGVGWTTPSVLAQNGVPYSYNSYMDVNFPGSVTSPQFNGALSGNATTSTTASTTLVSAREGATASHYLTFVDSNNASPLGESFYTDSGIYYTPSSDTLTVANLNGNAATATQVKTTVAPNGNYYLPLTQTNASSATPSTIYTGSNIQYNVNDTECTLTVPRFIGNITGDLTGIASTADKIYTRPIAADNSYYFTLVDAHNAAPTPEYAYTNSNLKYNPSTGVLYTPHIIIDGVGTVADAEVGGPDTQIANIGYVNRAFAANDAMVFKGILGTTATYTYTNDGSAIGTRFTAMAENYSAGWTYRVAERGTYAGNTCEVGDLVIAASDKNGAFNASDWIVCQTNIDGAITHTVNQAVGNSIKGAYVNAAGVAQELLYKLNADVNSGTAGQFAYYNGLHELISAPIAATTTQTHGVSYGTITIAGSTYDILGAGKNVEGTVFQVSGVDTTAGTGAEIFNDYRPVIIDQNLILTQGNIATGVYSHAEGSCNTASGAYSHVEGAYNTASGVYSHAQGFKNIAGTESSFVFGEFSLLDNEGTSNTRGKYMLIAGNGVDGARSNAMALDWNGNLYLANSTYSTGLKVLNSIDFTNTSTTYAVDITAATSKFNNPICLSNGVTYGTTLPATGVEGQIFFLNEDANLFVNRVQSTTDNALVRFDGATGDIQNSGAILTDTNQLSGLSNVTLGSSGAPLNTTYNLYNSGNTFLGGAVTMNATAYIVTRLGIGGENSSYKLYTSGGNNYLGGTTYLGSTSVYSNGTVLYGAAWNDYAEYRQTTDKIEPGRVVVENGDDTLSLANKRLLPGCEVISDTFGMAIGQTDTCDTPIAVAGRVLVYTDKNRDTFTAGDAVCSGLHGTVSKMTRNEIKEYPERIIGTVSAIPSYDTWGEDNIKVNGRIWIKLR